MTESSASRLSSIAVALLVGLFSIMLGWAVLSMPSDVTGLEPFSAQNLPASGAENPVTAVLLNYRAYDTLLEIAVLFLAILGAWSLRALPSTAPAPVQREFLSTFTRVVVPLMVLVGVYLLWAGTKQPGGAFQAGAVLAAAGVLLVFSSTPLYIPPFVLRILIVVGFLVFTAVGLASMLYGHPFLYYRDSWASVWILVIEVFATITIGLILLGLFGGHPSIFDRSTSSESDS